MDMFVIRGGRPLRGKVAVSGSKNAALPIMAASLAARGPVRLRNVPHLADVATLTAVLESLGMRVTREPDGAVLLEGTAASPCVAEYDLVRKMRASVCVLGPLLARYGKACVSLPGGCNIGHRPIDLHLRGLRALGADVRIDRGYVMASAARLHGAVINLCGPHGSTVTGTCNVMTAAALATGTTVIESAAAEPEVVDLGEFLNRLGARISGLGTSRIVIDGVRELGGGEHSVIPDRIEAATLLIAAAATHGDLEVLNARSEHLAAVMEQLEAAGVGLDDSGASAGVAVRSCRGLRAIQCTARPYPGLPTDVQAQLTSLLTAAEGVSRVGDEVFPDRFMHLAELARMGARVRRDHQGVVIDGAAALSGASVMASDLRASAALVIAALAADGESVIRRIYHLDRGYERLESKLTALGADVQRIRDAGGDPLLGLGPARRPAFVTGAPLADDPPAEAAKAA